MTISTISLASKGLKWINSGERSVPVPMRRVVRSKVLAIPITVKFARGERCERVKREVIRGCLDVAK